MNPRPKFLNMIGMGLEEEGDTIYESFDEVFARMKKNGVNSSSDIVRRMSSGYYSQRVKIAVDVRPEGVYHDAPEITSLARVSHASDAYPSEGRIKILDDGDWL